MELMMSVFFLTVVLLMIVIGLSLKANEERNRQEERKSSQVVCRWCGSLKLPLIPCKRCGAPE